MRFLSVFIVISWFVILPLLGQDVEKPKDSEVWLRFMAFGSGQSEVEAVIASEEKLSDPFKIRGDSFSSVVTLPSTERLVTLGNPVKGDDEKLSIRPITKFELPKEGKRFLVVLVPKSPKGLRAIVIRGDGKGFQPGEIQFINLSNEDFGADLGGTKFKIAKNGRKVFRPIQTDKKLANYQMRLFSFEEGKKPRKFAATLWPYLKAKRAYIFLYREPKTKKARFLAVDEYTSWL